jgi:thiol-disulfide isomerase/thioredoxin
MKALLLLLGSLVVLPSAFAAAKGAEPAHIARGAEVALADHLAPGLTTIFDFTSKFCGPCQVYNEPLARLHEKRPDLAVVKVDINRPDVKGIDWKSPVARQYNMQSIPHFKVYGPDGKLLAEGPAARAMVDKWIAALD